MKGIIAPLVTRLKKFNFPVNATYKSNGACFNDAFNAYDGEILHASMGFYRPELFSLRQFITDLASVPEYARPAMFWHTTSVDVFPYGQLLNIFKSEAYTQVEKDMVSELVKTLNLSHDKDLSMRWR